MRVNIRAEPVKVESNYVETSYIVTFVGDDRPGLVEQLSAEIEKSGGNWHESRLSQLGGKFAGLIHVSLPAANGDALAAQLQALSSGELNVRVTPTGVAQAAIPGRDIVLTVLGADRAGIVREISSALAQRHINVVEMDSEVSSAPMSAEMMFKARIQARIPETADMGDLSDSLDDIGNQMTLEIDLD
jgi:glycine cleavage system regulatory protein